MERRMLGRSYPGFGVSLGPRAGLLVRFEHVKDLGPSAPRSGCSPVSKTRQASRRTRPKANACRPRSVPVPVEAVPFGACHIATPRAFNGVGRDRTGDVQLAKLVLSRLSYNPKCRRSSTPSGEFCGRSVRPDPHPRFLFRDSHGLRQSGCWWYCAMCFSWYC